MVRALAWICLFACVLLSATIAGWVGSGLFLLTLLTSLLVYWHATAWRLGRAGMRLFPQPVQPGQPLEIGVVIAPARRLTVSRILLGLRAHQTKDGVVTVRLHRTYELANRTTIEPGTTWKRAMQVELPEAVPPSGPGPDGQTVWLAELEIQLPGWPTFFEIEPLQVAHPDSSPAAGPAPPSPNPARSALPAPGCLALLHLPLASLFLLLAASMPATTWREVSGTPARARAAIPAKSTVPHSAYTRLRLLDRPGTQPQVTVKGTFERTLSVRYTKDGHPRVTGQLGRLRPTGGEAVRLELVVPRRAAEPQVVGGELALVPMRQGLWPLIWFAGSFVAGAGFWICLMLWLWRFRRGSPMPLPFYRSCTPAMLGLLLYTAAMAGLAFWLEPFPWSWMWGG